jgi:hypothetical protein
MPLLVAPVLRFNVQVPPTSALIALNDVDKKGARIWPLVPSQSKLATYLLLIRQRQLRM